ncbi:MAG: transglycosylase domain-containing protein [Actinomycetota bacterium]
MRIVDYPRWGKKGFRRFVPSWKLVLGSGLAGFCLAVVAFAILYARVALPDPNQNVNYNASVVYWSDGKSELGRFSDLNRRSIPLQEMPETFRYAVLSAEDRSFYQNRGVSPRGIGRAVWVKVSGGSTQGGSTITQQYVKNYYLTQDRTVERKVNEFIISLKVEQQQSKDTILENYLNTIYYGRGAYGIDAASRAYFGKPAKDLTLAQGALLASAIQTPSSFDPINKKERAQARWEYVLDGMVEEGWITAEDREKQKFPSVKKQQKANTLGGSTGYLLAEVRQELKQKMGLSDEEIDRRGLRIVSTFDQKAHAAAVEAVKSIEVPTVDKDKKRYTGIGLAAVKPGDGAVVAMYGGADAVEREYNDATQATLQAGSTFKPCTLAAALQQGRSLRSIYSGASPQTFNDYTVGNFGSESFGDLDLVQATAKSVNTVYVALNEEIGPEATRNVCVETGIPEDTPDLQRNLANVLGTASPRVIDVARMYSTFAAQGERAETYMVKTVTTADGKNLYKATVKKRRVLSSDVSADVTYALRAVVDSGSGYKARDLQRPAAGKTGTTNENKSAWFAGYTPQLATAVGFYQQVDGQPASLSGFGGLERVTGGSYPAQVWTAFMKGAMEGQEIVDFPEPVFGGQPNKLPEPEPSKEPTKSASSTKTPSTPPTKSVSPTPVKPTKSATPTEPGSPQPSVPTPSNSNGGPQSSPPNQPQER